MGKLFTIICYTKVDPHTLINENFQVSCELYIDKENYHTSENYWHCIIKASYEEITRLQTLEDNPIIAIEPHEIYSLRCD